MTKSKIHISKNIFASGFKLQTSSFVFKPVACSLWRVAICSILFLSAVWISSFAQESNKLVTLTKQIVEAKTNIDLYPFFEELKDLYFKDNKYSDFVEFLQSLSKKKKTLEPFTNYYIAVSRYHQLKYLEETQNWDEYFSHGNTYREEITEGLQKTIQVITEKNTLNLYARLMLWRFHKDQQDVFHESALSDLMSLALEYSKGATDIEPIKDVADTLFSYGEKGKSKELYKSYVDKLVTSGIKDEELSGIASGFYKEGNLELSQAIYNIYTERIAKYPKEKLIPILIDIATKFSYRDKGPKDAFYAEQIFNKIEDIGGKDIFDEGLIYLRAFNLEKIKEYNKAKDIYIDLTRRYPNSTYIDEADFKIGIIYTYILRDIQTGRNYFEKLSQETKTPQVISGLYQLGLLSQWEEDLVKARQYYNRLIEKAKDNFIDTVTFAKERLKEIDEAKSIEYNLKTFLDVSLKEEYSMFDTTKLDLKASIYRPMKGEEININSSPYISESGCMQVELEYLWSGYVGTTKPSLKQPSFNTTYLQAGTKVINLVVVSPAGVVDRNIEMVDVY